ncbi:ABC transporter permease [Psychrobacillus psychrodurans]|uniref:ABC transporter permease n=1 Tax=Psychrobacillus TaxID=1221880 RepID=UPI0008E2B06F|nr:ABC transporter permease [Psychrobacillus psychrodurans]MCK1997875.1 ABC transporter permease [Psychrobacillus psychrodurans]MCZ8541058.1 ABC transporter permease [Psychrobacillus psychrodurans]SFM83579.1 ABC-2 type transport system permease protein [Psychrobacillus psychrodurans]
MSSFIKKDILVFWRDRKEILMALLLPIILIVILNFAFSGLFKDDEEAIHIDIALLVADDEKVGKEQFEHAVKETELSPTEKEKVLDEAANLNPVGLIHDFLINPEIQDWITIKEISEQEATKQVNNGDLDAIIRIPEGFTYEVLSVVLLDERPNHIPVNILAKDPSTEVGALQDIVHNFVHSLNVQFALGSTGETVYAEPVLPQGGREVVEGIDTYSISQYFTIAISTLFALFLAQTVALKTVTEKRERVVNRILLTNSNPINFLLGKTVSTFILVCIQMVITFTAVQLLLSVFPGKTLEFWVGLVVIMIAFSLTVAGLSSLFTSIVLHLSDSNTASGLFTLIIMGLGVLGGSFFPLEGLPNVFQKIGEWTPNGLTQTTAIKWIQFSDMSDLFFPLTVLTAISIVCFAISMSIFPNRGRI